MLSPVNVSLIGNLIFWSTRINDFEVEIIVGFTLPVSSFVDNESTSIALLFTVWVSTFSDFKYLSKMPALKAIKLVKKTQKLKSVRIFNVLLFFILQI